MFVSVALAGPIDLAFLRGTNVILASQDGSAISELKAETRPKDTLRWLPDGGGLSYTVASQHGGKGRLVIIDLAGQITNEVEIRPPTDPPTEGMRFVEDVDWVSENVVRIGGSINPRNCENFDLNVKTQKESNGSWERAKHPHTHPMVSMLPTALCRDMGPLRIFWDRLR